MKWLKRAALSSLWGLGSLVAVNAAGAFTGVTLGYSWMSVGTAALLGVPGVILLTVLDVLIK